MLALISPAKKLDFSLTPHAQTAARALPPTIPALMTETEALSKVTAKLSKAKIRRMMDLSEPLAALNFDRFQAFHTPFTPENAKPAALAFNGDTYVGLDARSLGDEDMAFAQDHLRILSGFYGLLRPLDLMQAYRLEMGVKIANRRGEDLYDFWGDLITEEINGVCKAFGHKAVINLASAEYIKAVRVKNLAAPMINMVFREVRDGQAKVIGLMAKRARGMMARYMILERLETPEQLQNFSMGGYRFDAAQSDESRWIFNRPAI